MEIERKFLVECLPENLTDYPKKRIEQAYLSTDPVVRVRRSDDSYYMTYKGRGLLAREEYDLPLTEEAYNHLLAKADGNRIAKDRWCIPLGPYTVELDVFDPPFAPLMVAEVEFPSEEAAAAFQPPAWFGQEVTYDPAYTNARLSQRKAEGEAAAAIRPGRYRHFKGKEYRVLYTATHSETREPMVVYQALYGEWGIWARPAAMWNESVTRDGITLPRFTYLGED